MEIQANNNSAAERVNSLRKSLNLLAQSRSFGTVITLLLITYFVYFMYYLGTVNSGSTLPFTFTINRAKFFDTDNKTSFKLPNPEELDDLIRTEGSGNL